VNLANSLNIDLSHYKNKKLVLALSGGVDSVVLLHILKDFKVRAIHINHNINKDSKKWEKFCQNLCDDLNIELQTFSVVIDNDNNLEEKARKLRYQALFHNLKNDEILLTAHHKSDQAETFLLNLFRGSGSVGLAGMQKINSKINSKNNSKNNQHHRPFLSVSKQEILKYATKNNLKNITDESNFDIKFRRNFIRQEVLPILKNNYPSIENTLVKTTKIWQENVELLDDLAKIDIKTHNIIKNNLINIKNLKKLENKRIKNIIYYHLKNINFRPPSSKVMQNILTSIDAKIDSKVLVVWGGFEMRIFQHNLYFLPKNKLVRNCEFFEELKNQTGFNIKFREYGQRIKFANKAHSQSLKKLMQEKNIPPWERDNLRMYYIFDELIAIEKIGKISNTKIKE
jgi:tRNA(Ile)-lysidine synthase